MNQIFKINNFGSDYDSERQMLADAAAKNTVKQFISECKTFNFVANFNTSKVVTEENEKFIFNCKAKNLRMLGISSGIKSEVKLFVKNVELLQKISNYVKVQNNYNYSCGFDYLYNAYEYDLNSAYTSVLHSLFLSNELYEKMIFFKKNYNFNINEAIGMALLGQKIKKIYKKGKSFDTIYEFNQYRPLFFMIKYLVTKSLQQLLASENYIKDRVAFYVDAIILQNRVNISLLAENFYYFFLNSIYILDENLKKYEKISLFDIFNLNETRITNTFSFKVLEITNLRLYKNELTGSHCLQFNRENNVITYK